MMTPEQRLYEAKAEVLQAVAHPIRLAIVELLADGPMCVCDIVERVDAKRSNVSRHLGVMSRAGVLSVRKQGLKMIYELATPCVMNFLSCVERVVRHRLKADAALLKRLA